MSPALPTPDAGPAALQARLRRWYPNLAVRSRRDVAGFGLQDELWYVFRDGLVAHRHDSVDRLYVALHEARETSPPPTPPSWPTAIAGIGTLVQEPAVEG